MLCNTRMAYPSFLSFLSFCLSCFSSSSTSHLILISVQPWTLLRTLELSSSTGTRDLPNSPTDPKPELLIEMEDYLIRILRLFLPSQETEDYIIKIFRPFLPSQEEDLCFHHNAKTWTKATTQTLKEHYDRVMDRAIETITALLVPDWDRAFLVASHRAKHDKHITQPSLDETYNILRHGHAAHILKHKTPTDISVTMIIL